MSQTYQVQSTASTAFSPEEKLSQISGLSKLTQTY
jgi:hypothetical protein